MLELSDKYFKTTIIEITNTSVKVPKPTWNKWENRKSWGRNSRYKEKWNGNLELRNAITTIKKLMDRLNTRMEETVYSEPDNKTI